MATSWSLASSFARMGAGSALFSGVSSKVDFRAPSKMQGPRNQNLCTGAAQSGEQRAFDV